jgi:hypothetical protein
VDNQYRPPPVDTIIDVAALRWCGLPGATYLSFRGIIETFIIEEKNHEETLLSKYNDARKTKDYRAVI